MPAKKKQKRTKRKTFEYAGIQMASPAETLFAAHLDKLGVPWQYESEKFEWIPPKRKYTPDFTLPKKDGEKMFIEYKGYLRPGDKRKMKAIRQQYPHLDIRLVFYNAAKKIYKGAKSTYADWAEKHGFKWAENTLPQEWLIEIV